MPTKKEFCVLCDKVTDHSFSPNFGLWFCDEKHKNPCSRCAKCGDEMDEMSKYVALALGADRVVCKKCRPAK